MRILLFLLLTSSEILYISLILDASTSIFDTLVLILMFLVSLFVRFILYSAGFAPKWILGKDLRPGKIEAQHILKREAHLEPPRKSRRKV